MERRRAAATSARLHDDGYGDAEDADELGVFAAERYFHGEDDAPWWCGRSSSSLSSAFRTGTQGRSGPLMTAATSSSEASWNSRSALLLDGDEQVLAAVAVATTPDDEVKTSGAASDKCRAGTGRRPSPPSNLRRWLLGVAVCACAPATTEEWASTDGDDDEVDAGNGKAVLVGGNKSASESAELSQRTESKELAYEASPAARLRHGGRHYDGDDAFLARRSTAPAPVQLPPHGHRQAGNSGDLFLPILNPAVAATFDDDEQEQQRRSFDMFRPLRNPGGALVSTKPNSAFTIVAGNTARGAAPGAAVIGGKGPGASREEDSAAPSEIDCAYPPSEASIVWSVVTADGAASGNFSSAASGCYRYYFNDGEREALRRSAMKGNRRRSVITGGGGGGLLTCMNQKAVDAVGPSRSIDRPEIAQAAAAMLGAGAESRNGHGRGYRYSDLKRRR